MTVPNLADIADGLGVDFETFVDALDPYLVRLMNYQLDEIKDWWWERTAEIPVTDPARWAVVASVYAFDETHRRTPES